MEEYRRGAQLAAARQKDDAMRSPSCPAARKPAVGVHHASRLDHSSTKGIKLAADAFRTRACGSVLPAAINARSAGRSHPLPQRPNRSHRPRLRLPPRTHHRSPQLVHPGPRGLIAAQPENALQTQRADPVLLRRTCQIARNHSRSGLRVSWKIVPEVTDVCRPQRAHSNHTLRTGQARSCPHPGQRKPSGQRNADR